MNNYILFFLYVLSSVIAGFSFGLCIYIIEWVVQSGAEIPFAFAFFPVWVMRFWAFPIH